MSDLRRRNLNLLTTSSARTFHRCRREYLRSVEQGYQAIGDVPSLAWGTAWHAAVEYLWSPQGTWNSVVALERAMAHEAWGKLDDESRVDVEVLVAGYVSYWSAEEFEPLEVEIEYRTALVNPDTRRNSQTTELGGKIDAIARRAATKMVLVVEHKSSSLDISAGSAYWERLKIDAQCSNYLPGARSLGYEPDGVLYDVVKKPQIERRLATPLEKRKYTKEGKLYANQREFDETLDEYKARLIADVTERPEFYFCRGEVVRLESETLEAARDLWDTANLIHMSRLTARWPRNTDACERYGKFCQFWPACTGSAEITDTTRYQFVGAHRELSK